MASFNLYDSLYSPPQSLAYTDNTHFFQSPEPTSSPSVWGPFLWSYLHIFSANYPIRPCMQTQISMQQFLLHLGTTIPCEKCRLHYQQYIENHKEHMLYICSSRETLFSFLVELHNDVNRRSSKPEFTLDQAKMFYGYVDY